MTHKITGTVSEESRLIIIDELDFTTLEHNDTVSGTYDVTVTSGSKTVLLRSSEGETFGYGAVNSKDDGVVENIGGIDADTFLMLHLDEESFVDSSFYNRSVLNEGVVRVASPSKFGYSGYWQGPTRRRLMMQEANFWSSDFTIDFWINLPNRKTNQGLVNMYHSGNYFYFLTTGSTIRAISNVSNTTTLLLESSDLSAIELNIWHHIALERYGNLYNIFVDGTSVANTTDTSSPFYSGSKYIYFGYNINSSYYYDGYIDELRCSTIARYQGQNFTPPPIAYSVEE